MAIQTPAQYFADDQSWGSYQFITLKELVDNMLADSLDSDNYLANTKRSQIVRKLKEGIRVVNRSSQKMFHVAQLTVGPTLYFALPQNFVDWIRVSVIDKNDRLQILNVNRNINTSDGYLQNNEYEILFDVDGQLLTTDLANAYQNPFIQHTFESTSDTSLISKHGDFKVNEDRGTIHFSSNIEDKDVVIEYMSDGLDLQNLKEEEIKIHKHMQDAVKWFCISEIFSTRKSVSLGDKRTARNRFLKENHVSKILSLKFDFLTIGREINSMPT